MNNVKTISYKGKPYVEVAERVNQVHSREVPFEVLTSTPIVLGDRVIWQVQVRVDGKIYTGSAEAKLVGAAPKSADATNPFECAETSALGRALAFAGFGSVDSIASYDEVARGATPDELRHASKETLSVQENMSDIPSVKKLRESAKVLNLDWDTGVLLEAFAKPIQDGKVTKEALLAKGDELPPAYCKRIAAYLQSKQAA